ncbi:MAG: DUF1232 domain-containing protein [SAR202 cluster bacterium]|nr:DUF1232 domain-containing protein [SAR202 cluster bacterium]
MVSTVRRVFGLIRRELKLYRILMKDSRTPRTARMFLAGAVAYAFTPLDLLPNLIPIIGFVDDLIIIPILVYFALRNIPKPLISEGRARL